MQVLIQVLIVVIRIYTFEMTVDKGVIFISPFRVVDMKLNVSLERQIQTHLEDPMLTFMNLVMFILHCHINKEVLVYFPKYDIWWSTIL